MLPIIIFLVQSYSTKIEIQKENHDCDVFSMFRFCDVLCTSSNHELEASSQLVIRNENRARFKNDSVLFHNPLSMSR